MLIVRCANGLVGWKASPSISRKGRALYCLNDGTVVIVPHGPPQAILQALNAFTAKCVALRGAIQEIQNLPLD